jgi:hypothetical protein
VNIVLIDEQGTECPYDDHGQPWTTESAIEVIRLGAKRGILVSLENRLTPAESRALEAQRARDARRREAAERGEDWTQVR